MKDRHYEQLRDIADADYSEWRRLVEDNQELQAELRDIRVRYGLPFDDYSNYMRWLFDSMQTSEGKNLLGQLHNEINSLAFANGIPDRLRDPLYQLAVCGEPKGLRVGAVFPSIRGTRGQNKWEMVLEITRDTPIDNPHVLDFIRDWKRKNLLANDPPPQPLPIKGNARKLDWSPVREWHTRHPDISYDDLAGLLHMNTAYVRRKMRYK